MKEEQKEFDGQPGEQHQSRLIRRAINQLAFGSIIVLWGSLLALKQAGILPANISTWPYPLTVFGILLVAAGIYRLSRPRRL